RRSHTTAECGREPQRLEPHRFSRTRTTAMKLPNVSTLAGLSLLAACASKSGAGSQDPDAANYDGYYSETPGEGGADGSGSAGHRPQARASTSTRHIDRPVGKHIS